MTEKSVGNLESYSHDLMQLCQRSQYDMTQLRKQRKILQKAFEDVEEPIADLIIIVRKNQDTKQSYVNLPSIFSEISKFSNANWNQFF